MERFATFFNRRPPPGWRESRAWKGKKESVVADLREAEGKSPVFEVLRIEDLGPEIRTIALFKIPTLIKPGPRGEVRTAGPVLAGIRYHESFLTTPPVPWGMVCVFAPADFYHPNASEGNGVCLGSVPSAPQMEGILQLAFAALALQSAVNTVEWQGLNPEAAQFVRSHAAEFPIVETGFYEAPPAAIASRLLPALPEVLSALSLLGGPTP